MKPPAEPTSPQPLSRSHYKYCFILFLFLFLFTFDFQFILVYFLRSFQKLRSFGFIAYGYRCLSQTPPFSNDYHSPYTSRNFFQVLQSLSSIVSTADQNTPALSKSLRITHGTTCDPFQEKKSYRLMPPTFSIFSAESPAGVAYNFPIKPPCLYVVPNVFLGSSDVLIQLASQ